MVEQTREEIKRGYIDKMGEPLGTQFSELWQEVAVLFINWEEYVELFGTKPERIKLLNKVAPVFFHMLQEELWETRLLHLARLTDPPISMGNKQKANLTINNLLDLIDHADTKKKVQELTAIAMKATDFSRDWRNRHIAHRDLDLALNEAVTPLAAGSREQVGAAINAIADVMNAINLTIPIADPL